MGTSQGKIARIEGGDENVTIRTLERLADALGGVIRLAIQPAEMKLPELPPWWEMGEAHAETGYTRIALRVSHVNGQAVAGWSINAGAPQKLSRRRPPSGAAADPGRELV